MKYKHTKWFLLIYAVYFIMTATPLYSFANKPVMVLGMPMFLTYQIVMCLLCTLALLLNYKMDRAADRKRVEEKKGEEV